MTNNRTVPADERNLAAAREGRACAVPTDGERAKAGSNYRRAPAVPDWSPSVPVVRPAKLASSAAYLAIALAVVASGADGQPQADFLGTVITGNLTLVRTVNLRAQSHALLTAATVFSTPEKQPKMPPPRLQPPKTTLRAAAQAATSAAVQSLVVTSASAGSGFNALSHLDQRLAYDGNQFSIEPPSPSVAVANGYVLEGVNNGVQVYTASGAPVLPRVLASNQVFGLPPAIDWATNINGVYMTDMRVYFDGGISRWFIIQRSQDNDAAGNPLPHSHLYMAVSGTDDPAGDYLIYVMDTTNGSHPGCPCIADYPQIGADQHGFHISWNEFNAFSLSFLDASIMSVSKAGLASGASAPAAHQFFVSFTTGYEFAIQPAATPPGASSFLAAGGVEYLVSSSARFFGTSGVALWAIRNTSSLATPSPRLVLSRVVIPTLAYTVPDVATQRPGPLEYGGSLKPPGPLAFLDGGDNRVLAAVYAGGRLYLTLQTAVQDEKNRFTVGGAYVVLSPTLRSNNLGAIVLNQGYLMVNGNHLLRPAIAVNARGIGAIAVTLVGPDWYPSAAYIPFSTFATPTEARTSATGAMPEDGFTGYPGFGGVGLARWGDYNGAVAAADGSIWMVTEYIGNYPRTTFANWNTFVTHSVN